MSAHLSLQRSNAPLSLRRKLFLRFQLGSERYVIAASDVESVLALAPARRIPSVPEWVLGLVSHRGRPVPVVDLSLRARGTAAQHVTSTRLVMVHLRGETAHENHHGRDSHGNNDGGVAGPGNRKHPETQSDTDAESRVLGIVVENVNETVHLDATAFVEPGIQTPHARYLGPVLEEAQGFVQWLRVNDILDDTLRATLYARATSAATGDAAIATPAARDVGAP